MLSARLAQIGDPPDRDLNLNPALTAVRFSKIGCNRGLEINYRYVAGLDPAVHDLSQSILAGRKTWTTGSSPAEANFAIGPPGELPKRLNRTAVASARV